MIYDLILNLFFISARPSSGKISFTIPYNGDPSNGFYKSNIHSHVKEARWCTN